MFFQEHKDHNLRPCMREEINHFLSLERLFLLLCQIVASWVYLPGKIGITKHKI